MSKLVVHRRSEWANRARAIGLYLDGQKIASIKNGETEEFDLQPGHYKLKAKIDWCGSQVNYLDIGGSEVRRIELTSFSKYKWALPVLVVIQISLLILSFYFKINDVLMITVSICILIYILYPISFGRNHYLNLKRK